MEPIVLAAEARLETRDRGWRIRRSPATPPTLQLRITELEAAQRDADRLYARWAELEAKRN